MGGRVRRWWWGVNNWKIPDEGKGVGERLGKRLGDEALAEEVREVSLVDPWR